MSEARDLAIKLFGKTIALPATVEGVHDKDHPNKEETTKDSKNREQESPKSEDKKEQDDDDEATESGKNSNPEEEQEQEQNESSNSQDKLTLKKPDKLLPCPRCNSLDTKFCYFNNYNVNQPRHFCKNCQRYWTAGGTMRNVPVGAGRRKNKSSIPSHYRHLTVSDPNNNPNGTVLSFGSDTPLYNGIHHREEQQMEEQSCANSNSIEEGIGNCHGFVSPWPFPYMPPPNMSASAFQMPFYPTPAPYWGCNPWSMPWLPIPTATLTLGKHTREEDIDVTNNVSETREETTNRLWFPKTLRIADPEEASKSSIWTTMGFNSDKADSTGTGRGFFKSFQKKKGEVRAHLTEASQALHANPAALSRAISFQESS